MTQSVHVIDAAEKLAPVVESVRNQVDLMKAAVDNLSKYSAPKPTNVANYNWFMMRAMFQLVSPNVVELFIKFKKSISIKLSTV